MLYRESVCVSFNKDKGIRGCINVIVVAYAV